LQAGIRPEFQSIAETGQVGFSKPSLQRVLKDTYWPPAILTGNRCGIRRVDHFVLSDDEEGWADWGLSRSTDGYWGLLKEKISVEDLHNLQALCVLPKTSYASDRLSFSYVGETLDYLLLYQRLILLFIMN
jgi:hypothetical protein